MYYSCGSVRWTSMICLLMFIFLTPVIEDWETAVFLFYVHFLIRQNEM